MRFSLSRPATRRLFLIACVMTAQMTQTANALIAGSYNIRYVNSADSQNGDGWKRRAPVIASLVRFHQFDILGTQEAYRTQLDDLQGLLPAYAFSGCGRDDGKAGGEHAAIFYRKDVFNLKSEGTFWLSETPAKPSVGWDAKLPRICTWVHLEDRKTHRTLFAFNTHFDHKGTVARRESALQLLRSIREIAGGQPSILTGDFNVDQTSESYKIIEHSELLEDSYDTAAERYALNGTPNGFNVNAYSESRIDHVFHTVGFKTVRYGILTDSYRTPPPVRPAETGSAAFPSEVKFRMFEGRTPSDHFPVLVEFQ